MKETTDKCKGCGAPLNKKELITKEIYGAAICDICMGNLRRQDLAKDGYKQKLLSVPLVYRDIKFDDADLGDTSGTGYVIMAEDAPVSGTQWLWDTVKLYWRKGMSAKYVSVKDMNMEFSSLAWQNKKEYVDRHASMDGMLAMDDIGISAPMEMLSRIIEHRAEHRLYTVLAIHVPQEELSRVIGDKAYELVSPRKWKWRCITGEENE